MLYRKEKKKNSSEELAAQTVADRRHNRGTESTVLTLIHIRWSQPHQFENPLFKRGIIHLTTH